jgi:hypothetical protein
VNPRLEVEGNEANLLNDAFFNSIGQFLPWLRTRVMSAPALHADIKADIS